MGLFWRQCSYELVVTVTGLWGVKVGWKLESRVEGVAKVEAVARDKTRVPQGDMFNIMLIIPSPVA